MFLLANNQGSVDIHNYMEIFLKNKAPDCIIYSEDGAEFKSHKELFSQTKFMREILKSANCYGVAEIICPCSKEELGHLMNFFNEGKIECNKMIDSLKIIENLNKILGYPIIENLDKILGFSPDINDNVFPYTFLKEHSSETFNESINLENNVIKRPKSLATPLDLKQGKGLFTN